MMNKIEKAEKIRRRVLNYFKNKFNIKYFPFDEMPDIKKSEILDMVDVPNYESPVCYFQLTNEKNLLITIFNIFILDQKNIIQLAINDITDRTYNDDIKSEITKPQEIVLEYKGTEKYIIEAQNTFDLFKIDNILSRIKLAYENRR